MGTLTVGQLNVDADALQAFCKRWGITEIAVFGSVLRNDFGPLSDVDVLVSMGDGADRSLHSFFAMEAELAELVGRDVDIVEREAVAENPNWLARREILGTARTLHVA